MMKITVALLLMANICFGQSKFAPVDTLSSPLCSAMLSMEYKSKFERINKSIAADNSAKKNVIKGIYSEIQDDFLERINDNQFMCDAEILSYLDNLMDQVLAKNSVPSSSYKILLSRDSDANAYNTGDGTIVIHYGLFVTLESEDELVYVICHEIGHQHLNHVRGGIEEFAKLSTSEEIIGKTKEIRKQKYGKATMAGNLLKRISYQNYSHRRLKEIEADSIGLEFYRKTLRNPKAAISTLEKLNESDIEKDSLSVADYRTIFENSGFLVKERYFDSGESLFKQYDAEKRIAVDSLKTHPDCTTRIDLLTGYLNNKVSGEPLSSANFDKIKENSRYQNLLNLYTSEKYGISMYEALKYYKTDLQNPVLRQIIYRNLIKLQASRMAYTVNRHLPSIDLRNNTESQNRFISFINNIKISDFDTMIKHFTP